MQRAETVLNVYRERGRRGLPLERVYRQLYNPHLYLLAYANLYSNAGATTRRMSARRKKTVAAAITTIVS